MEKDVEREREREREREQKSENMEFMESNYIVELNIDSGKKDNKKNL